MYVFSERHKIVNVLSPVADAFVTGVGVTTDIVHLENYKKCTFIVVTGADVASVQTIRVFAGVSNISCATPIVFKYRTQAAVAVPGVGSDVPLTLTDATVAGFPMIAHIAGQVAIIEVDAAVVAAAGANFDHCALHLKDTIAAAAQVGCVIAILSEPRYPQDVLETAID
jgi:hypothetical protein